MEKRYWIVGYGNGCGKLWVPAPNGCVRSEYGREIGSGRYAGGWFGGFGAARWDTLGDMVGIVNWGAGGGTLGVAVGGNLGISSGGTFGVAVGLTLGAGSGVGALVGTTRGAVSGVRTSVGGIS